MCRTLLMAPVRPDQAPVARVAQPGPVLVGTGGSTPLAPCTPLRSIAAIVGIARNPIFKALHAAVTEWLEEHWARSNRASGESQALGLKAHAAIYEAIAGHDRDRAEREMAAHLDRLIGQLAGPEPKNGRVRKPPARRTTRGSKGGRARPD